MTSKKYHEPEYMFNREKPEYKQKGATVFHTRKFESLARQTLPNDVYFQHHGTNGFFVIHAWDGRVQEEHNFPLSEEIAAFKKYDELVNEELYDIYRKVIHAENKEEGKHD